MEILIGTIKHCTRERIDVWAKSASKYCKSKKVLLCLDEVIPNDILTLSELGFDIQHYPTPHNQSIEVMKFERHLVQQQYFKTIEDKSTIVLLTDTFDVVFQDDPFEWYRNNKSNKLLLGSEGIIIQHEWWNYGIITKCFDNHTENVKNEDVLCAGVIMGEVGEVENLSTDVFNLIIETKSEETEGVDQGAVNVILRTEKYKDILQITNTSEPFVVHCATAGPTEQFVSWGFQRNYKYGLPIHNGNEIVTQDGKPYCMVHQYNRIKEWDSFFKTKYSEVNGIKKYGITSENSIHHWQPFNFKDKYVLDLGCGRWFGVEDPIQFSPIWFGTQGATNVVGVDMSQDDINFYNEYTKDDDRYRFICKGINTTKDVEDILKEYPITALKSDIEGFETLILDVDVNLLSNITEMAIEFHSHEIRDLFINKFKEWGYTLHTIGNFTFAGDHVGVLFATK